MILAAVVTEIDGIVHVLERRTFWNSSFGRTSVSWVWR